MESCAKKARNASRVPLVAEALANARSASIKESQSDLESEARDRQSDPQMKRMTAADVPFGITFSPMVGINEGNRGSTRDRQRRKSSVFSGSLAR